MKPNDMGGPAFPMPYSTDEHSSECNITPAHNGMTLWDVAAIHAMQGYIAGCISAGAHPGDDEAAKEAAYYADALLAERAKRAGGDV